MADATSSSNPLMQLETTLEEYLVKKAPALPDNIKEIIVKFTPWVTLIVMIIAIPAVLALLGLSALFSPFAALGGAAYGMAYGANVMVSGVVTAIALVLEALAIPGLFKRSLGGWRLVFYASLVSVVSNILSGNIISGLIGTLIGLYVLFQVKSMYK